MTTNVSYVCLDSKDPTNAGLLLVIRPEQHAVVVPSMLSNGLGYRDIFRLLVIMLNLKTRGNLFRVARRHPTPPSE